MRTGLHWPKAAAHREQAKGTVGSLNPVSRRYLYFMHNLKPTDSLDLVTPEIVEAMCEAVKYGPNGFRGLGIVSIAETLQDLRSYREGRQ